jgi:dihydroorotase-like cyclic amidohydrolase
MSRIGILSKHIVVTEHYNMNPRCPLPGLILILGEFIEDVILLEGEILLQDLIKEYKDWKILDYSDYYISPGLIDLNVRREWEDISTMSKAAIQGGVTVIAVEEGYYNRSSSSDMHYCDVAEVLVINDSTDFNCIPDKVCALKGYLFPPSPQVKSIAYLENILCKSQNIGLPLFLDATLPESRMLYMASPLRLESLNNRINQEINYKAGFGGAYPENPNESDSSSSSQESDENSEVSPFRTNSLQTEGFKSLGQKESILDEELKDGPSSLKSGTIIIEAKEDDESSPLRNKSSKKKISTHNIYHDLDDRIKARQLRIEDICKAESSSYSFSGSTHFLKHDTLKKFNTLNIVPNLESTESDSSEPGSAKILQRREKFRPRQIIIKPETRPDSSSDYKYHLANYPENWEVAGVKKVIQSLNPKSKIHFMNLSSSAALNKIRKIKRKFKDVTCEIPAVHLYFTSASVSIGDTRFKNTPPVRNEGNCNLLWDLLKMKGIDSVSSQHACIDSSHKQRGNFLQALNGISSIGCTLQSVWSVLNIPVSDHELLEHYLVRLAKWLSWHPSLILNLNSNRGNIAKGKYADLVIWNPWEKYVVDKSYIYSDNSPFINQELLGSIKKVYLRGNLVFDYDRTNMAGVQLTNNISIFS